MRLSSQPTGATRHATGAVVGERARLRTIGSRALDALAHREGRLAPVPVQAAFFAANWRST